MDHFWNFEVVARLLLATVGGGVIGWERERLAKPAGLRTHMLVALGAAAYVLATLEYVDQAEPHEPAMRLDPIRTIAGIVGGVGFLGAGSIIEARGHVRGLTTAASIWASAAIGTSCGLGLYDIAVPCVLLSLGILVLVGFLECAWFKNGTPVASEKPPDEFN